MGGCLADRSVSVIARRIVWQSNRPYLLAKYFG